MTTVGWLGVAFVVSLVLYVNAVHEDWRVARLVSVMFLGLSFGGLVQALGA